MRERVFITGLGFITSIGNDKATVLASLLELKNGIELYPPLADNPKSPVAVLGTLKGFDTTSNDPEDWIWPGDFKVKREQLRWMSPHVLYATMAMDEAIRDAGLTPEDVSNEQTGIYTASAGSTVTIYRNLTRMHNSGIGRCPPTGIVAGVAGTLSFNLVANFQIRGSSCGFASACASSNHALGFAVDAIRNGQQQRMFVVGAEDGNIESVLPFAGMRALTLSRDPETASRPFDRNRDGFVGTGGAVVLVLESETAVKVRSATPYAEILGWGQASDGYNVAISHPEGDGLARSMRIALADAKLPHTAVDYVNAHGTSTPIGDVSEAKALKSVFGEKQPLVSSTKAITGHGLSLAGAMETAFCALAVKHQFVPGNAHLSEMDPECAHLNIPTASNPTDLSVVINNSSGFGGANVTMVLSKPTR